MIAALVVAVTGLIAFTPQVLPPHQPSPPAQATGTSGKSKPSTAGVGAAPDAINFVRQRLKPGTSATYEAIATSLARAYDRAKLPTYWLALQSRKDAKDILYLQLYQSREAAETGASLDRDAVKQHPELARQQQRLSDLVAAETSTLTTRRDDIDRGGDDGINFATMRGLRVTIFQVQAGREGEFVKGIRTANAKEGYWLVYEANDAPTFVVVTLKRSSRSDRRDGSPVPRSLRRLKGAYSTVESKLYAVRPAMSHVPRSFVAANPRLWRG